MTGCRPDHRGAIVCSMGPHLVAPMVPEPTQPWDAAAYVLRSHDPQPVGTKSKEDQYFRPPTAALTPAECGCSSGQNGAGANGAEGSLAGHEAMFVPPVPIQFNISLVESNDVRGRSRHLARTWVACCLPCCPAACAGLLLWLAAWTMPNSWHERRSCSFPIALVLTFQVPPTSPFLSLPGAAADCGLDL